MLNLGPVWGLMLANIQLCHRKIVCGVAKGLQICGEGTESTKILTLIVSKKSYGKSQMKPKRKSSILSILSTGAVAMLFLWASSEAVRAQTYSYDFIPTQTELYPLSDYVGSFVELTAPSGVNVDYTTAIAAWNFVTPQGTLTTANSHVTFGDDTLSWNASTITAFDGGAYFYIYSQLSPIAVPETGLLDFSYYVGNNTYNIDGVFGYWEAVPGSVAEPPTMCLMIPIFLGALFMKRLKKSWRLVKNDTQSLHCATPSCTGSN
jgi:hypothetical protein